MNSPFHSGKMRPYKKAPDNVLAAKIAAEPAMVAVEKGRWDKLVKDAQTMAGMLCDGCEGLCETCVVREYKVESIKRAG